MNYKDYLFFTNMRNRINILIIGYGSIGKRHAKILSNQKFTKKIFIYSKNNNHNFKKIKKLISSI